MSFHKRRLPSLEDLKQIYSEKGKAGLEIYQSADALIGSKESSDFIKEIFEPKINADIAAVLVLLNAALSQIDTEASLMKESKDLNEIIKSLTTKIK
jgi:hypothetical protein